MLFFLCWNRKIRNGTPKFTSLFFLRIWLKNTREANPSYSYRFLNSDSLADFLLEVEIHLHPRASNSPTYSVFHMFVTVVLKTAPAKEDASVYKWNPLYIGFTFSVFLFQGDIFNFCSTGDFILYLAFLGTLVYNLHIYDLSSLKTSPKVPDIS